MFPIQYRTRLMIPAIAALLTMLACAPQAPAPDPAAEAKAAASARTAIDEIRAQYGAAENAGDAAAIAAFYTDDGVYLPANMPAASGKAEIQARYEQIFAQISQQGGPTAVSVDITGDWAIERGTYKGTLTPKAGGAAFEDTGKYVAVFRKTESGWKVHYLIWNSDLPMPGGPQ